MIINMRDCINITLFYRSNQGTYPFLFFLNGNILSQNAASKIKPKTIKIKDPVSLPKLYELNAAIISNTAINIRNSVFIKYHLDIVNS